MPKMIPTGVEFFDNRIGGMYSGSLIILLEEVGAGGTEFAITALMNNDRSCYISLTKTYEDFKREMELVFPERNDANDLIEKIKFQSFAKSYFSRSIVPLSWISDDFSLPQFMRGEKSILKELIDFFENLKDYRVCYLDSLSDLIRLCGEEISWRDLIDFLMGLKIFIRRNDIVVYTTLIKDVIESGRQEEILNQADGVLVFKWKEDNLSRKRIMYIKKLLGVLPSLEREGIEMYETRVDPVKGFTISNVVRII